MGKGKRSCTNLASDNRCIDFDYLTPFQLHQTIPSSLTHTPPSPLVALYKWAKLKQARHVVEGQEVQGGNPLQVRIIIDAVGFGSYGQIDNHHEGVHWQAMEQRIGIGNQIDQNHIQRIETSPVCLEKRCDSRKRKDGLPCLLPAQSQETIVSIQSQIPLTLLLSLSFP